MDIEDFTQDTFKLLIEPALDCIPLKTFILDLAYLVESELEFIAKHRKIINDFHPQDGFGRDLVLQELAIDEIEFSTFNKIVLLLFSNHNSISPKENRGQFNSMKNGITFTLSYIYEIAYILEYKTICYDFNITEIGKEDEVGFSFILSRMKNGKDLKVVDLYPDPASKYIGKGISIAIICHAKTLFNKKIISSSFGSNWKAAREKVWEPMKKNGLVGYNSTKDFYYTIN